MESYCWKFEQYFGWEGLAEAFKSWDFYMRRWVQDKSGQFHFSRVGEAGGAFCANFESTSALKFSGRAQCAWIVLIASLLRQCVERWLKVCKKCSTGFFRAREVKLAWLVLHFLAHVGVPTFESICRLFLPKILLKLTTRTFRIDRPGYNQQCKKVKKMRTINPQIISSFLFGSCSKICKVIELNWGQRYFQNWFAFYSLKWYYTLSQSKCVTTGSV